MAGAWVQEREIAGDGKRVGDSDRAVNLVKLREPRRDGGLPRILST